MSSYAVADIGEECWEPGLPRPPPPPLPLFGVKKKEESQKEEKPAGQTTILKVWIRYWDGKIDSIIKAANWLSRYQILQYINNLIRDKPYFSIWIFFFVSDVG